MIEESLKSLVSYIERESFKGYDPYDILNSKIDFLKIGTKAAAILTQIHKRNPVNVRSFIGIKKEINPKGAGLLLKAYCLLYCKTHDSKYLEKADFLFSWLSQNISKGYSGKCWGYNFDWASPGSYLKAYTPSVVVTSFIIDGIFEYYKITNSKEAAEIIRSSASYIINDIPVTHFKEGISFAYTHLSKGCCYNASLLAAEILAKTDFINNTAEYTSLVNKAVDFVLSKQMPDGRWNYSYNTDNGTEREQIDFHQGFILVSLDQINSLMGFVRTDIKEAVKKGLSYYRNKQFFDSGQALWRIPYKWPVDIHNQSQGIITFTRLQKYGADYISFAQKVAEWTIENMLSDNGYFYYRKNLLCTNKIPYMRWSQAWMMLALAELISNE
ncbi:MAG: hypothetical protein JXB49_16470 [Bacteroidales bacterium]|nr:hypothetical protein [Bacteroidales bacterium]